MNINKTIAIMVGVLFIIGTVAGVLSVIVSQPLLSDPGYLENVAANGNQLILGALLILTMGFALSLVPIVFYPLARRYNPSLAVGYVVFRGAIETVMYILLAVSWLVLIALSKEYAAGGDFMQNMGDLLVRAHASINNMLIIVFSLGAIMLYLLLYQSRLIPRWLSLWGLVAILMHLATAFLILFGLVDPAASILIVVNFPIFLQEMVMALWLIIKGFNPSPIPAQL